MNSINFDGESDFVLLPDDWELDTGDFTISADFKLTSTTGNFLNFNLI